MDLESLDTVKQSDEGVEMHVEAPDGQKLYADDAEKKLPMMLLLRGGDSTEVRTYRHKLASKKLNVSIRKGELSVEQTEDDNINLLAMCTTGCRNIIISGDEVEHSQESMKMLYRRFPWIKEQADVFIGDRLNYLGNLSKTS